jgi:hypothetical protein
MLGLKSRVPVAILVWYGLPISRKSLKREGGYCSKQVFANQDACLAESKSLANKILFSGESSLSSRKVCVNLFMCVQSPTHNV